jgi:hypothetical protein
VLEECQRRLKALLKQTGVDLDDGELALGVALLGIQRGLSLLKIWQPDGAIKVGIEQLFAASVDALEASRLGGDQLLVVPLLLGHLPLYVLVSIAPTDRYGRSQPVRFLLRPRQKKYG